MSNLTTVAPARPPNPYTYKPLARNEIRLINLFHGHGDDPLQCDIIHSKLQKPHRGKNAAGHIEYKALSYTWGAPEPRTTIMVGEEVLQIAPNLASAMLNLRRHPDGHLLWIDALSINQEDLEERGKQVMRMTTIYALAEMVFCWLGPSSEESDLAMETISDWSTMLQSRISRWGSMRNALSRLSINEIFNLEDGPTTARNIMAIHHLFDRPWWFRTWVLQEASSPPEKTIVCGDKVLPWQSLAIATMMLLDISMRPGYAEFGAIGVGGPSRLTTFLVRREYEGAARRGLLNLIGDTRKSESTDPRDKVYAMLAFASDVAKDEIIPDYTKSVEAVYTEVALWSLTKHNNLDVFGLCAHTETRNPNLPSWVPDWTDRSEQRPFAKTLPLDPEDYAFSLGSKRCYDADGSVKAATASFIPPQLREAAQPYFSITGDPQHPSTLRLTASGLRLTSIACLLPVSNKPQDTAIEKKWIVPIHPDFPIKENPILDPLTSEPVQAVYLRTIVADTRWGGAGVPVARPGAMHFPEDQMPFTRPWSAEHVEETEDYLTKRWNTMAAMKEVTQYRRMFWTGIVGRDERRPEGVRGAIASGEGTAMFGDGGGLMGLAPHCARVGDQVFVLKGGSMLYVLRPVVEQQRESADAQVRDAETDFEGKEAAAYTLVGECYVHGLMDGQALKMLERKQRGVKARVLEEMDEMFRGLTLV